MPVVTEEQHAIMLAVERIARNYKVPRSECLLLVKLGFEAGTNHGLTAYSVSLTNEVNEGAACQPSSASMD